MDSSPMKGSFKDKPKPSKNGANVLRVEELKIPIKDDVKEGPSKSPMLKYKEQIELENERLIDSVSKVTELLRANQFLRDEIDKLSKGTDNKDNEIYTLT